ncbi:MAG: hypothetical protein EAX89_03285 [Candidatus Lokiarchaeota archaeon]|nr:hypothetical protein [Candidatus Lokiarchaeota archaeon]
MTYYEFSVITNTGFPYHNLKLKKPPEGVNLYLRFYDFSRDKREIIPNLNDTSTFELNAGLISALFEFARNINKKIELLEFKSKETNKKDKKDNGFEGDVLITVQTEPYLLHKSVKEKIKIIYDLVISSKIPLDSALDLLQNEIDIIIEILNDSDARNIIKKNKNEITNESNEFLSNMKSYGLNGICITSFDLSPIILFGKKYKLDDVDVILRNIGVFPEISPFEWIYRQSNILNEQIWVYIIKSGVGPTVNGLFEPYFYLLFADPQSYLGEFPAKLTSRFNQILG